MIFHVVDMGQIVRAIVSKYTWLVRVTLREQVADQLEQARQQAGKLEAEKEEGNRVLLGEILTTTFFEVSVKTLSATVWSLNVLLIAGKLANTLESQYQCPTCLDLFISPVSLNCGHTYCWLCLAQWRR